MIPAVAMKSILTEEFGVLSVNVPQPGGDTFHRFSHLWP